MNLAIPILISHQSEDFRSLLREMLMKHGFFHLLEASTEEELLKQLSHDKNAQFIIVQGTLVSGNVSEELSQGRNFLILAQPDDEKTMGLAAKYGVEKLLSFPFSSQLLLEKVSSLGRN